MKQTDTDCILGLRWAATKKERTDSTSRCMFVNFIDVSDAKKLFSYRDILENTQDVVIVTGPFSIAAPLDLMIIYINDYFYVKTT